MMFFYRANNLVADDLVSLHFLLRQTIAREQIITLTRLTLLLEQ